MMKNNKILIHLIQILIIILFLGIWEYLSFKKIINPFLFSSPSKVYYTLKELIISKEIYHHLATTIKEVIISFSLGISLGLIIAIILYECKTIANIFLPFLTMLNSLPKVALGPMIIMITGANTKAVITMALLINLIISILNIYNGFLGTDKNKILLLKSLNATKKQILYHLIIKGSFRTIISSLKINISMTLIGVIMGEFLVSKEGIGYLIIYGMQIFNLNLVITGIFILIIFSITLYITITFIEHKILKKF